MTLYRLVEGDWVAWGGEAIDSIRHPLNIESIWEDADLNAIGLYKLVDPGVPAGKVELSRSLQLIDNVLTIVYVTRDVGPADCPITMRQLRLGLKQFGGKRANYIQGIIDDIVDPSEQDAAQIWFDETEVVEWDNPMTQYFITKTEFTAEQAGAMWMAAYANIPR